MGMITSIVLIFGVFGLGDDGEAVRRQAELQERELQEKDRQLRGRTTERSLAELTVDELAGRLVDAGKATPDQLPMRVQVATKRASIAEELLTRELSPKIHELAATEKIRAIMQLYGFDYMTPLKIDGVADRLSAAFQPNLEDSNPEIAKVAWLARLTHTAVEQINQGDTESTEEVAKVFMELVKRFPDDALVNSLIKDHFILISSRSPEFSERLVTELTDRLEQGGLMNQRVEQTLQNAADKVLVLNSRYEDAYSRRWDYGGSGQQELAKATADLLKVPKMGKVLVMRVAKTANWFEQQDSFEAAKGIYDDLVTAVNEERVIEADRNYAKLTAAAGLQRQSMVGQKVEISGEDSNGLAVLPDDYRGRVLGIVYWSARNAASVKALNEIDRQARSLTNKDVSILAICMDQELNRQLPIFVNHSPVLKIFPHIQSDGTVNNLLNKIPPSYVPQVVLVDTKGVVRNINVEPGELNNRALLLLLEQK